MDVRKYLFEFTPLGKADKEVREFLKDNLSEEEIKGYRSALNYYRHMKVLQGALKILLYASIVTSVFATVGFEQAEIIQRIASYIGTTFLFILYAGASYITMIRRENYHVQREILIARAS